MSAIDKAAFQTYGDWSKLTELGAAIEHDYDSAQCAAFAREYGTSVNEVERQLATFALYTCTAKCERRAGRIQLAQLAELQANAIYAKLPAKVRW